MEEQRQLLSTLEAPEQDASVRTATTAFLLAMVQICGVG